MASRPIPVVRTTVQIEDIEAKLAAFEQDHPGITASNFPDVFRVDGHLVESDEFFAVSRWYAMLAAARTA